MPGEILAEANETRWQKSQNRILPFGGRASLQTAALIVKDRIVRLSLVTMLPAILFFGARDLRTACLASLLVFSSALLPCAAQAQHRSDEATGAAAAAVRRWFSQDLALECSDPNGVTVHCGPANMPVFHVQYGNAGGGSGAPDALVFVRYVGDPTGNAEQLAVAVFRQDGEEYRFVRRLPPAAVGNLTPGTAVRFDRGQASWSIEVLRPGDSRSMPTGHKQVSVSMR